jgi:hypothetical protein
MARDRLTALQVKRAREKGEPVLLPDQSRKASIVRVAERPCEKRHTEGAASAEAFGIS